MTHQAPNGRPQPPSAPLHAGALGPSTSRRQHIGRALRLVAAAGTGAAGLCLVVGAVALVAAFTGPDHAAPAAAAARRPLTSTGARAAGSGRILAAFTGRGSMSTRRFTIGGTGTWTLRWSYTCQAGSPPGAFIVAERATAVVSRASVHAIGAAGHGATWTYRDAGTHYLAIRSGCAWTTKVVGQP